MSKGFRIEDTLVPLTYSALPPVPWHVLLRKASPVQILTECLVAMGGRGLPLVEELSDQSGMDSQKNTSSSREGSLGSVLHGCVTGNRHTLWEMPLLWLQRKIHCIEVCLYNCMYDVEMQVPACMCTWYTTCIQMCTCRCIEVHLVNAYNPLTKIFMYLCILCVRLSIYVGKNWYFKMANPQAGEVMG